jgi:cysteine-rich repeat protein
VYVAQSNHHSIIGVRQGGPTCLLIDQAGDGVTPFGFASRFAVAPDGDVYASNVGYDDVFKIDDPCTGPSVDLNGHWFLTRPDGGPTEEQNWVQSGFDLTVSDPGTGNPTFYGTIDDRNHIMLTSYATFPPFCAAYNIVGDATADGFGWAGSFIINATFAVAHCGEYERYAIVANRCGDGIIDPGEGCEDGNAVAGDGCDACQVEPCFACSGLPSVCAPAVRTCVGAPDPRGVSLKMRPASGGRYASLKWTFAKGAPVGVATLGDPRTTTDYDVCLFDGGGQLLFAARAAAGSDWRTKGAKGFAYKSSAYGFPDGITTLTALSGTKSKVGVRGGGAGLTLPALPLPLPVTLQVQASDGGCFALDYSSAGLGQNDASGVSLRADP